MLEKIFEKNFREKSRENFQENFSLQNRAPELVKSKCVKAKEPIKNARADGQKENSACSLRKAKRKRQHNRTIKM